MELKKMNCPSCGAELHFSEDQDFCFCSHCGTQVYKDEPNKTSFTYREIDDARIIEAQNKIKKLEFRERAQRRKFTLILIAIAVFLVGAIILGIVLRPLYLADSENFAFMVTMLLFAVFAIGAMTFLNKHK